MTLKRRLRGLGRRLARPRPPNARPTALIVDPDEEVGELLMHTLRHQGYSVRFAMDEARAIAHCNEGPIDVVFLDPVLLPWASGLALCRRLRRRSQAPVVLLTSRTLYVDIRAGLAAGAADYIGKPFSPRDVLDRLETILVSRHGQAGSRPLPLPNTPVWTAYQG